MSLAAPPVPLLSDRFLVLRHADTDEVRGFVGQHLTPYRGMRMAGRRQLDIDVSVATVGHLTLLSGAQSGSEFDLELLESVDYYDVHFTVSGTNHLEYGSGSVALSGWSAAVISPGMRTRMRLSEEYSQLHVRLDRSAVERVVERVLGRPITGPLIFTVPIDLNDSPIKTWVKTLTVLLEDLRAPGGLGQGGGEAHWSEFLIASFLRAQPSNYSSALNESVRGRALPLRLRRVLELIEADPRGDLTLGRLADVAGIAPRSLQRDFHDYLNASPRTYVEGIRLSRARDDLLAAAGKSVIDIVYSHGFTHVSRFAALYRRQYGESPSATLRNARSGNTLPSS